MRLARLRRGTSQVPEPRTDRAAVPVAPGPRAVFARVIDGESLWLAVEDHPAAAGLALRVAGDPVRLLDDSHADAGPRLAVRTRLADLALPDEPTAYELLVGSDADGWAPLLADPLPDIAPARTPPTRDGRWQYDVERAADGALTLTRTTLEPALPLLGLGLDGDAVVVTVQVPPGSTPDAVLAPLEDRPEAVTRLTGTSDATGAVSYRITAADLLVEAPPTLQVLVEVSGRRVGVVRRDNDLANPNRAVLCPETGGGDQGGVALRTRFNRHGRLVVRRAGAEDADE